MGKEGLLRLQALHLLSLVDLGNAGLVDLGATGELPACSSSGEATPYSMFHGYKSNEFNDAIIGGSG